VRWGPLGSAGLAGYPIARASFLNIINTSLLWLTRQAHLTHFQRFIYTLEQCQVIGYRYDQSRCLPNNQFNVKGDHTYLPEPALLVHKFCTYLPPTVNEVRQAVIGNGTNIKLEPHIQLASPARLFILLAHSHKVLHRSQLRLKCGSEEMRSRVRHVTDVSFSLFEAVTSLKLKDGWIFPKTCKEGTETELCCLHEYRYSGRSNSGWRSPFVQRHHIQSCKNGHYAEDFSFVPKNNQVTRCHLTGYKIIDYHMRKEGRLGFYSAGRTAFFPN